MDEIKQMFRKIDPNIPQCRDCHEPIAKKQVSDIEREKIEKNDGLCAYCRACRRYEREEQLNIEYRIKTEREG